MNDQDSAAVREHQLIYMRLQDERDQIYHARRMEVLEEVRKEVLTQIQWVGNLADIAARTWVR